MLVIYLCRKYNVKF